MIRLIQPNHIEVTHDGTVYTFTMEQAEHLLVNAKSLLSQLKTLVRVVQSYENPMNIATSAQLDSLELIEQVEGGAK